MLTIIYTILGLITIAFCVVYVVVSLKALKKGESYTQQNIKFRCIGSIVLFVLFSLELVLDIILYASLTIYIILDIFCVIAWAISIGLNFNAFKKSKNKISE